MVNLSNDITELKKYINKLVFYASREAVFNFGDLKILDKTRVDDLLCCIESNIPESYKAYVKSTLKNKPKSHICYMQFITIVRKEFFLSSKHYIVRLNDMISVTRAFVLELEADLRSIENS